jgi:regulator of protease activity HflC (stomatin/prohibitin superfamily)
MKGLIKAVGRALGIGFTPDNHVTPVLRLGRYHRVAGTGYFWITPLFERTLPAVKTSLHVANFVFDEVLSKDNIPFKIQLTVLFTFQPNEADQNAVPQLVQGGDQLFQSIVKDYTNQSLRRLVSRFEAEKLCAEATMDAIERDLTDFLTDKMKMLGLAPLPAEGILIKEAIPPEKFKQTMLEAMYNETILKILTIGLTPEHIQLLTDIIWAKEGTVIFPESIRPFRRQFKG